MLGLSCGTQAFPIVCQILVPQPRIELMSPVLEGEFLTTGPPGNSLGFLLHGFLKVFIIIIIIIFK